MEKNNTILDGIYQQMPELTYFASDAVSNSDLKVFERSPRHYRLYKALGNGPTSDAMAVGSALHKVVLEPETARETIEVADVAAVARSKQAAYRAELELQGKILLGKNDLETIDRMATGVREHPLHEKVFMGKGDNEVSLFHTLPNGVQIRGRIDRAPAGSNALFDLKSTDDASPESFGRTCATFGYVRQGAMYRMLWNLRNPNDQREDFVFVVVERKTGITAMYSIPRGYMEIEELKIDALLTKYAQCRREDKWEGYGTGVLELELPGWFEGQYLSEMEAGA